VNTALRTYVPIAALLVGALMVVSAFVQAGSIPQRAHDDFGALVVRQGGSLSSSPDYPTAYRQMSAASRMLQNAYLGVGGLILVAAGAFGLTLRPLSLRPPTGLAAGAPQREPPETVT